MTRLPSHVIFPRNVVSFVKCPAYVQRCSFIVAEFTSTCNQFSGWNIKVPILFVYWTSWTFKKSNKNLVNAVEYFVKLLTLNYIFCNLFYPTETNYWNLNLFLEGILSHPHRTSNPNLHHKHIPQECISFAAYKRTDQRSICCDSFSHPLDFHSRCFHRRRVLWICILFYFIWDSKICQIGNPILKISIEVYLGTRA